MEGGRCKALRDDCTITVKRLYQKPMKKELSRRFGGGHRKKRLDGRDHKKKTKIAAEAWGGKGKQVCQALNFPK